MPNDHLFLLSGTNDIKMIGETATIIDQEESLLNFFTHKKHVKVAVLATPFRYDNEKYNQHIQDHNKNKQELCEIHEVPFIDINQYLAKTDYSKDGLHINQDGKEKLANIIIDHVSQVDFN